MTVVGVIVVMKMTIVMHFIMVVGPRRMHETWPIATDDPVAWCLSLSRAVEIRLAGSTSCLGWSLGGPRHIVLHGGPHPPRPGEGI